MPHLLGIALKGSSYSYRKPAIHTSEGYMNNQTISLARVPLGNGPQWQFDPVEFKT